MKTNLNESSARGKNSAYSCNGASNHSNIEREENDFYATPPIATKTLVNYINEYYPEIKEKVIWECACGKGDISKVLKENGFKVDSTDIIDRGYGICGEEMNFLSFNNGNLPFGNYNIITNPPYKYAQQFVEKAMEIMKVDNYCCMLLKLTFLEGKKRYEMFKKYPPMKVLVFSDRINCALGGDFESTNEIGGAVCYAWYIWKKGYQGKTEIDWLRV